MKLFICLILFLSNAPAVFAQDLGPVGPKANGGSSAEKSSNPSSVSLPYKPAGTEGEQKPKSSGGHHTSVGQETENETKTPVTTKEVVIPVIVPKYPPSIGAPDIGNF